MKRFAILTALLTVGVVSYLLAADTPTYEAVTIEKVPHIKQKPDYCGEACTAMFLQKLGKDLTQDDVFAKSGLSKDAGRGCYTKEMVVALRNLGFEIGKVWYSIEVADAEKQMEAQFKALHADLMKGIPSIICTRYDDKPKTTEHFRLILGYDPEKEEVIYHEPAEKDGAYRRMKKETFLSLWPLKYERTKWLAIRMPLRSKEADPFSDAAFAEHIKKLKKRLPGDGFTIVIQKPFVVIGDERPEMVKLRSRKTVKWAVDRLKEGYFKKNPKKILDIWLFNGKESYEKNCKTLWDDKPSTPYGYYSPSKGALVMNIATGGGTLCHEIVHPFMESNFEDCPSWFNEGMGSLYEQCGDRNDKIVGFTNWRLAGLQKAIKAGKVPSFETLMKTDDWAFYQKDPGTNYSQARYLCYYLQQQGKLREYYKEFTTNVKDDPDGIESLKKVLGVEDLGKFKTKWEAYTLKLRYGR